MLFTDPTFLFLFLPVLLGLYFLPFSWHRNGLLLGASILFYASGGGAFTWLMLASIAFNYTVAIRISQASGTRRADRLVAFAVTVDLVVLGVFKYANFAADNVNAALAALGAGTLSVPRVLLPIGISFFTFHAISYVVDVYRHDASAQKSPVHAPSTSSCSLSSSPGPSSGTTTSRTSSPGASSAPPPSNRRGRARTSCSRACSSPFSVCPRWRGRSTSTSA